MKNQRFQEAAGTNKHQKQRISFFEGHANNMKIQRFREAAATDKHQKQRFSHL